MSNILSKLINLAGNITGTLAVANGGTGVTASTGTVANVLSTTPTLVTPILGVATATSVTWSDTTKGIIGTATNDNAAATYVGQYLENGSSSFTNAATSNQFKDVGSLTLTAGDWDVTGRILWSRNSATTASPDLEIGISGTSGNSNTGLAAGVNYLYEVAGISATWTNMSQNLPNVRVQSDGTNLYINGTTFSSVQVVYLKGLAVYSAGTPQYTYLIRARRVR